MAASVQKFTTQGPSSDTGERQRLYDVVITQSAYNSTASSNANLSLYDKEGELLWNWSSRRLQTNDFTGTEGLIRYLIRRATKKFPYFQRR